MRDLIKKHSRVIILVLCIAIACLIASEVYIRKQFENEYEPYNTFLQHLEDGDVAKVHLSLGGAKFKYELTNGEEHNSDNPHTEEFKEKILLAGVEEVHEKEASSTRDLFSALLTAIMIGVMCYMVFSMTSGIRDVDLESDIPDLTFKDVAGMNEIKEEFAELAELTKKRKTASISARMPRGILLQGPPGTGKTYLAKAFAGEVQYSFYAVNASQFGNVFAGLGAKQINNMFKTAKENAPSVIFIDEFDSLGFSRTGSTGAVERDNTKTLTALLANMDGFSTDDEVLVIAATNRAEDLDPALLRPGRFDKKLVINIPDKEDRKEVIAYHLKDKSLESDTIREWLLNETSGYTPAEIESLINEASLNAIRKNSDVITQAMFEDAITISDIQGKEKKNRHRSKEINTLVAYHEAGHAVIAKYLSKKKISKITILATTSGAGGYTKSVPETEMELPTIQDVRAHVMELFAGYCAEKLYCHDPLSVSIGSSNDLTRATQYIAQYLPYLTEPGEYPFLDYSQYGTKGADVLIERSEKISSVLLQETEQFLRQNWNCVERIANLLVKQETILTAEAEEIFRDCGSQDNA